MMTTIPWINITGNSPLTLSFNLFKDVEADSGVMLHCVFNSPVRRQNILLQVIRKAALLSI